MDENTTASLADSAARMAAAADAIGAVLARLEASQEALRAKVDRIIAAIEENAAREREQLADGEIASANRLAELQRENRELKAQSGHPGRKTLSPMISGLLMKNGLQAGDGSAVATDALDKALALLSPEQRIAVKAELARAGMIA